MVDLFRAAFYLVVLVGAAVCLFALFGRVAFIVFAVCVLVAPLFVSAARKGGR
ncbi:hypothetical protein [Xanthomonas vesicatoria]|uniref:hypothetical protein n=1 Tax=Xanthomonas vesicatoria TaxID=56460 RepID=UPI0002E4D642|nr:hypothetical protein [Xanthomonas vesicatoria]MCC8558695.1 hypothetical protein [Xanthomonas vesicatoria]MCC8595656.1 hypothetical protein [Xanthomonas vesicatoria]MCC8603720.1 hypothetical protein [Xanthomonas vesicatoria]MCC8673273.1 hypothetical protein [Xanthomonas vesicatoria]MCC8678134.1 hypothetical protein [Xanthomonas vesicatoria]